MPSSQSSHTRIGFENLGYDHSGPISKLPIRPPVTFQAYILGDEGVGITSLLQQLVGDTQPVESVLKQLEIRNQPIHLLLETEIADEKSHAADIVLLVCDLTNEASMEHLRKWYEFAKPCFKESTTLVVVGNKSDLNGARVISTMTLFEFAKKLHSDLTITTNATDSQNVKDLVELASARALSKKKSQPVAEITQIELTKEQQEYLKGIESLWRDGEHQDATSKIRALMEDYVKDCPTAVSYTSGFWDRSWNSAKWSSARPHAGTVARMLADKSLTAEDLYVRLKQIPTLDKHPESKLHLMLDLIERVCPELSFQAFKKDI
ncbi:MAG: Rab family GTPase [Gammaproteobacteria bacterium]